MNILHDKKESAVELCKIEGVMNEEKSAQKKGESGKGWRFRDN